MIAFFLALGVLIISGGMAVLASRHSRLAVCWGVGGAVAGCLVGLVPAIQVLAGSPWCSFRSTWDVPYGEFYLAIDPLTAWFLLPIFGVSALAAVYSGGYLKAFQAHKLLGPALGWFNVLVASMAVVVAARNAVLFLVGWEVMSFASFFLVTFEDEHRDVRDAGWTYLIAAHLGTAFLLALFVLLGQQAGSMNFDQFEALKQLSPPIATVVFLLALLGFGTKAGFIPLHVWLPEAHPAAPSHVSALMSGVMIKLGMYGILRVLTFLGTPLHAWGVALILIGLSSGILGLVFALAQHDLKRLLAYSSVENMGIIALGLGIGLLGVSTGHATIALLGLGGALLHVLDHSIFKSLLFLGAGSVLHAAGTRKLDELGGLLKQMPWTGIVFCAGAVAICGLPPFNGVVGEWLIYAGAFHGLLSLATQDTIWFVLAIAGLAFIGGLAVACFARAFGVVFLGAPRHPRTPLPHESGPMMLIPMVLLGGLCLAIGLMPWQVMRLVMPAVSVVTKHALPWTHESLGATMTGLMMLSAVAASFLCVMLVLVLLRRRLLKPWQVSRAVTWGCGYALPAATMQYTASSFSAPLTRLFRRILGTSFREQRPGGYFPMSAHMASHTPDVIKEQGFLPVFTGARRGLQQWRWIQQGRVQLYLAYIFTALIVLLIWKFGV